MIARRREAKRNKKENRDLRNRRCKLEKDGESGMMEEETVGEEKGMVRSR